MSRDRIHLEFIPPGRAPGGLYVRICTRERLLTEHALTDLDGVETSCAIDAGVALAAGVPCWVYFYDGDDGHCIGTLVPVPLDEEQKR